MPNHNNKNNKGESPTTWSASTSYFGVENGGGDGEAPAAPLKNSIGGRLQALLERKNTQPSTSDSVIADALTQEQKDWERRFPTLTVYGQKMSVAAQQSSYAHGQNRNSIKMTIARRIVQDHLWPQMQAKLGIESSKPPKP